MSYQRIKILVGILLLGGMFGISFWHIFGPRVSRDPDTKVIRIAHWLLQAGMREAFDIAAREYEAIHPDVRVEQIAIPINGWPAWVRTQLVGGTAPDLLGLRNVTGPMRTRYFVPITEYVKEPNPYNVGTDIEGIPWRDTFVDGLSNYATLDQNLGEYFAVMLQINSMRLFANVDLLEAVTGSRTPPRNFGELRELSGKLETYNFEHGTAIVPIASCLPYANGLFRNVGPQLTQKLVIELSRIGDMQITEGSVAGLFLEGKLSFNTPEVKAGLGLLKELSDMMQPGFIQMQRQDAHFNFFQRGSVMIFTGSWDFGTLRQEASFPVAAARLPMPGPEDPQYGEFILGQIAESNILPEATIGIPRSSPNRETAVDFLRFLSSQDVSARFCVRSQRLSAIVGVVPPPDLAALAHITEGELPGFRTTFLEFSTGHASNLFSRNIYSLLGSDGSVDAFISELNKEITPALRDDLAAVVKDGGMNVRQADTRISFLLARKQDGDLDQALEFFETQTALERETARLGRIVEAAQAE